MKQKTFEFQDAITAAVVAQRINDGYVRESNYVFNDKTNRYDVTSVGNKAIVRYMLGVKGKREYGDEIAIEKMNPVVTDADVEQAQEVCDYIEGLAMKALVDELAGYEKSVYDIYQQGKVDTYDFGMIASIPGSVLRVSKQEQLEFRIIKECGNSEYVGEVGGRIESDIELLNHIFSRNYGAHIYTAKTAENNLVTFWSQKCPEEIANVGDTIKIKAKVKRVGESRFYDGVKETQLNYVKKV